MKQMTVKWIIAGACLLAAGLIGFAIVMSLKGWDFSALDSGKYETTRHEITQQVINISVDSKTADIVLAASPDGVCRVELFEREKEKHRVTVEDSTLSIQLEDTRKWYERISLFSFKTPKITVYLPAGEYGALSVNTGTGDIAVPETFRFTGADVALSTGDVLWRASCSGGLNVKTSTGDITLEELQAGEVSLKMSTGKVTVSKLDCGGSMSVKVTTGRASFSDVSCTSFSSQGSTGNISLSNVIASGAMDIRRSTGDVRFDKCDAAEMTVETSTGDVTGSLLSGKSFKASSHTGKISVPDTAGGVCRVTTDTGRIRLIIEES